MEQNNVIFFDGVCNLCNATIDFIIRNDKKRIFKFSSLQSDYGQEFLRKNHIDTVDFSTVIYYKNNHIYKKSSAFIEIIQDMNNANRWIKILKFIPQRFRDYLYDIISNHRYLLFGKKETCRLPSAQEKQQFLE